MPGYVGLHKYTKQGITNVRGHPQRIKDAKEAAAKMGIKVIGVWVTVGQYDLVAVCNAPNDEAVSIFDLDIAQLGNITTQTMRAFSEEEFAQVVSKLP